MNAFSEGSGKMIYARGLRRSSILILAMVAGCAAPGLTDSQSTCTPGVACASGNPGACAAGHVDCTDGKTCKPDVTEQPCYGGEPETLNRGTCHGGTQSCIGVGKLGPCMGAVLPAAESCYNDLDDDCDGHVNNGCPVALTLGVPDALLARGGSGGSAANSMCPSGSLVTGVQVQLSATGVNPGYVVSVQPSCATPALVRDATSFSIALTPVTSPAAMMASDAARPGISHIVCAGSGGSLANGAQGSTTTSGRIVVEAAGIDCANVTLGLDANNKLLLSFAHDAVNSGIASVQVNGAVWNDTCLANEVLVGFQGRTGSQMDQIQGVCAPVTATYK